MSGSSLKVNLMLANPYDCPIFDLEMVECTHVANNTINAGEKTSNRSVEVQVEGKLPCTKRQ